MKKGVYLYISKKKYFFIFDFYVEKMNLLFFYYIFEVFCSIVYHGIAVKI